MFFVRKNKQNKSTIPTVGKAITEIKDIISKQQRQVKSKVVIKGRDNVVAAAMFIDNEPVYWMGNARYVWEKKVEYVIDEHRGNGVILYKIYI